MKAAGVREKTVEQLNEELINLLQNQFNYRMQSDWSAQVRPSAEADQARHRPLRRLNEGGYLRWLKTKSPYSDRQGCE